MLIDRVSELHDVLNISKSLHSHKILDDCVLYYDFTNGNTIIDDYSGNNKTGTNVGTTLIQGDKGNYSRLFNGVTNEIAFNDSGFPSGNSDRSILMWVKVNSFKAFQEYFYYGTLSNNNAIAISSYDNSGLNKLVIGKYGANASAISIGTISLNTWTQIGFTFNSNGSITYYINGVNSGDTSLLGVNTILSGGKIGAAFGTSKIDGYVGEIYVFKRTLPASEVFKLYEINRFKYY